MKQCSTGLLILILSFFSITGCSESDSSTGPATESGKSFLWEVSSAVNTVYILGSVHIGERDIYPLADSIEHAFDQSGSLVVEIDMTSENIWQLQRLMLEEARYPPGEDLRSNIPEELYQEVGDRWKQLGLNSPLLNLNLDDFEPWFVAQMLFEMEMMNLGYSADYGIDMYFMNEATESSKPIIGLETVKFQLDLLNSMPYEMQLISLEEIIAMPPTKDDLEDMFEAWKSGGTQVMEKITFESLEEYPEFQPYYAEMLDERNFRMVKQIEGYLEDDEIYFVVVGAGHLVGDNGIVELLTQKGYSIEQL